MANKTVYDHTVVKAVRHQALGDILEVLKETPKSKKFSQRKYDMLLKLASTVLPRLNAGRDDDERLVPLPIMDVIQQNNSDETNSSAQ